MIGLLTSELRSVNVITGKLELDQTSVAHTPSDLLRETDTSNKICRHIVIGGLALGNDCTG